MSLQQASFSVWGSSLLNLSNRFLVSRFLYFLSPLAYKLVKQVRSSIFKWPLFSRSSQLAVKPVLSIWLRLSKWPIFLSQQYSPSKNLFTKASTNSPICGPDCPTPKSAGTAKLSTPRYSSASLQCTDQPRSHRHFVNSAFLVGSGDWVQSARNLLSCRSTSMISTNLSAMQVRMVFQSRWQGYSLIINLSYPPSSGSFALKWLSPFSVILNDTVSSSVPLRYRFWLASCSFSNDDDDYQRSMIGVFMFFNLEYSRLSFSFCPSSYFCPSYYFCYFGSGDVRQGLLGSTASGFVLSDLGWPLMYLEMGFIMMRGDLLLSGTNFRSYRSWLPMYESMFFFSAQSRASGCLFWRSRSRFQDS